MNLVVLAVNQISEGDVVRLAARTVAQQLHEIRGAEKGSG
jgi:hypothetical protein